MKEDGYEAAASEKFKTNIGGQALMEGLLMLGPDKMAMAILLPDNEIRLETSLRQKSKWNTQIPVVRGAIRVFSQLILGTKKMLRSAEILEEMQNKADLAEAEGESEAGADAGRYDPDGILVSPPKEKKSSSWLLYLALLFGLGLGVSLFILLPNLITSALLAFIGQSRDRFASAWIYNLLEGFIRIGIILLYLWLTSKSKDLARVWMFHGAEHKTIACYEARMPLLQENVASFSRFHPRCGTSFLITLVFISMLVFAIVGWHGVWLNLLLRFLLIPLVAGISYEILLYSGKHTEKLLGRILTAPGLWLQRLTTKEPDAQMILVAIMALEAVIPDEADSDAWSK